MSVIDALLALVAPHDCLGCGREGSLLCRDCRQQLPTSLPCCYRCRRVSPHSLTCEACRPFTCMSRVQAATLYCGVAKALLWQLKSSGAQAAAKSMAVCMKPLLDPLAEISIIVPVPTASGRVRQRGYDQARLIARALSRQTGLPMRQYLKRVGQTHQVGSNRSQRLIQLEGSFQVRQTQLITGAQIILVDDVLTTGATLERAAEVLQQAGAAGVQAITFARPVLRKANEDEPGVRHNHR